MADSPILPAVSPSDPKPSPGDGKGPDRLRDSLSEAKSNRAPRGAYKCKTCGQKHGEGNPCGSGPQREKSATPAPAPVFTPENTGRLLRAPFTIAAVRTNCRIWLLSPAEEAELVATAVPCANEWIKVDPKWAALFMFAFSLGSVGLSKALDYSAWRQQMAIELAEEARKKKAAQSSEQATPASGGGLGPTPPPATVSTL